MMNIRTSIFMTMLFVVSMAESTASAISCNANITEPDFYIHGLCFSAYIDGQKPPDDYVSPEQIQARLAIITQKHHTDWIRTYSATHGLEKIPEEANKVNLKVAMGVWTRDSNEQEINNLVAAAEANYVDMVVVGNEELYAGVPIGDLIADINYVRQRLNNVNRGNIPITTAEPFNTIFDLSANGECTAKYPNLIEAVDVVTVYIYPFHEGIHIDAALQNLVSNYQCVVDAVKAIDPDKEVMIGETGWPSEGEIVIAAKPSPSNAARYFHEVQCWAARNDVNVFYFAAYDEKWKAPPEYAAHWGIWKSDGTIKPDFLPSAVFCEDFDPQSNQFCAYTNIVTEEPNVIPGDVNSDGNFMRILYDGFQVHFSSAAFNRVAEGPFDTIVIQFDFRMYGPDVSNDADGFCVLLIPTSVNGPNGCQQHGHDNFYAEQPKLSGTFGVGFRIWNTNQIYISWDKQFYPNGTGIDIPTGDIDLDSGKFHRARIEICCTDRNTALVKVSLMPNIYDVNHPDAIIAAEDVVIGDANHPYKPYENRLEFAGRNGVLTTNADIDNIYTSYTVEFCDYSLDGDVDENCRVNLFDIALMAQNWLIDCRLTPGNPACVAK